MDNLTIEPREQATTLIYGRVLHCKGVYYEVDTDNGVFSCERADGCLLRPNVGDLVLAATAGPDGQGFVLSVIKRQERNKAVAELDVQGELHIKTRGGNLNITSQGGDLNLAADKDLSLFAVADAAIAGQTLTAGAQTAELKAGRVSVVARLFTGSYKTVSLAAGAVEHAFTSLTQKLRNAVRMVEEHDEVLVGSARLAVEESYTVQTKNEMHSAEEIIKLDAEEVHLG